MYTLKALTLLLFLLGALPIAADAANRVYKHEGKERGSSWISYTKEMDNNDFVECRSSQTEGISCATYHPEGSQTPEDVSLYTALQNEYEKQSKGL